MNENLTRRQVIQLTSLLLLGPIVVSKAGESASRPREYLVECDGWILRDSDLHLTDTGHA